MSDFIFISLLLHVNGCILEMAMSPQVRRSRPIVQYVAMYKLVTELTSLALVFAALPLKAVTAEIPSGRTSVAPNSVRSFSVRDFGARGDGETDDTSAINAAISAAASAGGGAVTFTSGTYRLRRRVGAGQAPAILLKQGVSLDGEGCTLLLDDNCAYIGFRPDMTVQACIDQDVLAGDQAVHVDTTAQFAAGDPVGIRFGDNAWDSRETREIIFTTVLGIGGPRSLVLAAGLPRKLAVSETKKWNRTILRFRPGGNPLYSGGFIRNFDLRPGAYGNAESGIDLRCARNVLVENITAVDPGTGVVILAYCHDVMVRHILCTHSACIGGQGSKGRVLNAWNSAHCTFEDIRGQTFQGPFAFFESYCEYLRCVDWHINNDWQEIEGTPRRPRILMMAVQNSQADFYGLKITGACTGELFYDTGGTPGRMTFHGLKANVHGRWKEFQLNAISSEGLELDGQLYGSIKKQIYRMRLEHNSKRKALPGVLPEGLMCRATIEAKGLIKPENIEVGSSLLTLTPAQPRVAIDNFGIIGSDYPDHPPVDGKLYVNIPDLTETVDLILTMEYFPRQTAQ